ncbi:MAG TPA: antitoxin Xre/MbcA/ParS toxin-binding domain-containing protein [Rhodocyclaceae bacterium]
MTTTPSSARRTAKTSSGKKQAKSAAVSGLQWPVTRSTPKTPPTKKKGFAFVIRDTSTTEAIIKKTKLALFKGTEGRAFKGHAPMRTLPPSKAFHWDALDMVHVIRHGVPAVNVEALGATLHLDKGIVTEVLGLPKSTVDKKIKDDKDLTPEQSERVLGLQRLIGQVEVIVAESGDPTGFDAGEWLARWIRKPLPALGGRKPDEFLDTVVGQQLVSKLLAQIQSGAYA